MGCFSALDGLGYVDVVVKGASVDSVVWDVSTDWVVWGASVDRWFGDGIHCVHIHMEKKIGNTSCITRLNFGLLCILKVY